jgi:rubrerythrin
MRAGVVNNRLRYLFFVTSREGRRVLTGYYRIAWYCDGPLSTSRADYALAADRLRFIHPSVPLDKLPDGLREHATRRFRTSLRTNADQTQRLLELLDDRPDRTGDYLNEIDRLERFNRRHTGFRCWRRTKPFSWQAARDYLRPDPSRQWSTTQTVSNMSPTGRWHCQACGQTIRNDALLKACPACNALGSLRPITST